MILTFFTVSTASGVNKPIAKNTPKLITLGGVTFGVALMRQFFQQFAQVSYQLRWKKQRSIEVRSCAPLKLLIFFGVVIFGLAVSPNPALARTQSALETKPIQSIQPYLDRVIDRVTEFKLENGIKFIVLERHQAPVVSFLTYADVGGANEPDGKTGVAHFLEHLAFKGTTRIGTQNYQAERPLLAQLDQLAEQIQLAKEPAKVAALQAQFDRIEAEAVKLVRQNELGRIVEQAGGVGLNANTSSDATRYFYSFPANKLELWLSL